MDISRMAGDGEHTLILALGDSISEANHCTEGHPNYLELLDAHLRLAFGKRKYAILNVAVGGAKASESLDYVRLILSKASPAIATVMYGMNDSVEGEAGLDKFSSALSSIIELLRSKGAAPLLLTQNPIDYACGIEMIQVRKALPAYMERIRECSRKMAAGLVDVEGPWRRDVLSVSNNEHFKMMHDGIHPNQHGHRFIFERLKEAALSGVCVSGGAG